MTLAGTRPPTVDEWEKYELHHRARLAAKPGLTGMWQVSGRSNITDFEEVVELDREYISHWSMGLDLSIEWLAVTGIHRGKREIIMDDKKYLLQTCKHCGNKGLLKIVADYKQHFKEMDGTDVIFTADTYWLLLECPVCKGISLYKSYTDDTMVTPYGYESDVSMEYPGNKYDYKYVPESILKSYQAAVKTSKVDLNVCLIAIRAVLEKICKERGSKKKNLEAMLKEMVNKNILPETLDQCSFLIRKLGNSGAHGDDIGMSQSDVLELIDFIETILYYIYELPIKIANVNDKYNLKLENKAEKTLECE